VDNDIQQILAQAKRNLERYQTQGPQFQVSNAAETIARCYRLMGIEAEARRYFTVAAWASRKALDERIAQGEAVERNAQWGYTFKSLWMYYQAGSPHRVGEALPPVFLLLDGWPAPVPLLQRMQGTLACYVADEAGIARALYERFELSRWVTTPWQPEVKLLKAGLFGDRGAAMRAAEIATQVIAEEGIQPWFPNQIEHDLVRLAQALMGQGD
jgi:hypothetical protein